MAIKNLSARYLSAFSLLFTLNSLQGQVPCIFFNPDSITANEYTLLKKEYGKNKTIPANIEKPVLIALSYYPELINTAIIFRIKKRHTPLQSRSTWTGLFSRIKTRSYVITITDTSEVRLSPLLFKNVSFNAQIGAAGHELAHVADFSRYSFTQLLWHGARNLSAKYLDKFEFKTDSICIAHGLGYQLLAWSKNVRKTMNTTNWRGPDYCNKPQNTERYMNPETIRRRIRLNPVYPAS